MSSCKSIMRPLIPTEPLPASIFSLPAIENQVDIARKLQDDPLYLIKKKEIENREQLLKNPRKIKQLQEMLARQQAAAEKSRRKQIKKDKKSKKSKDLDALLAKKCKTILGGFDMKKLIALESDTSSESSSTELNKYKKKKKSDDLDKLLALKYKKLAGKVDPRKLLEMSSSSESNSSVEDKKTETKKSKKAMSFSENDSSSDDQNMKKTKGGPVEKQHFLNVDGSMLKRNRLKGDSKRDSSNEVVDRNSHKLKYNVKSKYRGSSCDSQGSHEDKKQKLHKESKILHKSRDFYRDHSSAKDSHYERHKNKSSEQRNECDEKRNRHEKNDRRKMIETNTGPKYYKSKKKYDKHSTKKSIRSNTKKFEKGNNDYSDESSSSSSCKETVKKRDFNKYINNKRNERHGSDALSCKSRSEQQKPYVKSIKHREATRKTKLSNSSSDSDSSLDNKKSNKNKQYGLVLPANYVPKKTSTTAKEKLPALDKTDVKPFKKEQKQKLTEEEKEKRLQEMMNNAKWRDDLRDTNIKSYKKKLEKEKDDYVYSEDFMRNQMSYAMSQGTVESRVKAKINTIQRNKEAMSENFARR